MSETQPELKNMVNDLFGDSSDEEDNSDEALADNSSSNLSSTPALKSTIDEDDLFNSDDESEVEEPVARRLSKGPVTKKRERSDEVRRDSKTATKKNRLSKSGSSSSSSSSSQPRASEEENIHDSDDEYDSGEELVRTKDDDRFLDNDEDDEELLREYERDNDVFDDERPDSMNSSAAGRGSGSQKKVNGGGGIGMIDPNTSNPFEQTLLALKRNKAVDLTDAKKGEIAGDILSMMNQAAEEDRELYQQGLPAVKKLQMLTRVERAVTTKSLQATLLDYDLLSVLKSWIEPVSKTVLAGLTIRNAVYDLLKKLPCATDHLKRSQIGKTLMILVKHKQETSENKRKIREIIDKWSRPIFGKSVDARNIDIRERLMHETSAERQHRAAMIEKNTSNIIKEKSSRQFELKTGEKEEVDDGRGRARLPMSHGLMFTVQPQSNIPGQGDSLGSKSGGLNKAQRDNNSRNNIVKRLKDMKQSSGKKNFRLVQADIGGRDKA